MKSIFKAVYKLILLVFLVGVVTGVVDYYQLKNNDFPLFAVRSYDAKEQKETFQGLFYKAIRNVSISPEESIPVSKQIKFLIFIFDVPFTRNPVEVQRDLTIETEEEKSCSAAKLYYHNDSFKVYTYCLDTINVNLDGKKDSLEKSLAKDATIIDKITNYLFVDKTYPDGTIQYVDLEEANLTNKGISVIRCKNALNRDIYIGPKNMEMQEDFCTNKDDVGQEAPTEVQ